MTKKTLNPTHYHHQLTGFSLIESLVALIIISIGLLGLAALQTSALRNTQMANIASQATISAHDIIERMRSNPTGMQSKAYNAPSLVANSDCYTTTGCTPTEMAKNDMHEWIDELARTIPQSSAITCLDSTPDDGTHSTDAECDDSGDVYAIKIWSGEENTPTYQRFVTTVIF